MPEETKGTLLVILAMLIFGFLGIAAKFISASPLMLLFSMQLFGLLVIFVMLLKTKKFSPKGFIKIILIMSIFGLLTDFFFFSAVKITDVSHAVFIRYTTPVFILLLMPFVVREKVEKKSLYSIPIALAGLFLIIYQGNLAVGISMLAAVFAILSAVTNASALVLVKKITSGLGVYTMMFYRFLINTIILLPFAFTEFPSLDVGVVPLLALFGIVFAGIGITMHFEGIKRIKIQRAGILGYIDPLSATLYGIMFLSEVPTVFTLAGGFMILLSSYIIIKN